MDRYSHYSFDLWLTLIKSNPLFKEKRDLFFYEICNPLNKSLIEVSAIVKAVDVNSNLYSELSGVHVSAYRMIYDILIALGYKVNVLDMWYIREIVSTIQKMFVKYLPSLYDDDTLDVLNELKDRGCTMNILSNTGFILGDTLELVLPKLELNMFDFRVYSDQIGNSKPSISAFVPIHTYTNKNREVILHVGDNPIADGGSVSVGIKFFQINSNDKRITDLL